MSAARLRLVALCMGVLCVGVLCVAGVVVGVVATGRDGGITDLLAIAAVATFVVARRLHRRRKHELVAD